MTTPKKTAIILMNLGTPDEPSIPAVRQYLKEFLSDKRIIEMPKPLWSIILNLFVLTIRPKKVVRNYASIWQNPWGEDSPMRAILNIQKNKLHAYLNNRPLATTQSKHPQISVHMAMTYGNPAIKTTLKNLADQGVERFIVFALYPQYSATSTGAAFDAVAKTLMDLREVPELIFIKDYHDHPKYIAALAESVRVFWAKNGRADKLLMSFHGIPKPYADKGDPYATQCHTTASLVAKQLNLQDEEWAISFQSRFGAQEWMKPYTNVLLEQWAKSGVQSVQIIGPAFSADCLETLEELAVENRNNFINAGGKSYAYIPALNANDNHIALMADIVGRYL